MLQRHLARIGLTELELKLRLRLGEDRYHASKAGGALYQFTGTALQIAWD